MSSLTIAQLTTLTNNHMAFFPDSRVFKQFNHDQIVKEYDTDDEIMSNWPVVNPFDETLMEPLYLMGFQPTPIVHTNGVMDLEFSKRIMKQGFIPLYRQYEQAPFSMRIHRPSLLC